MLFLGSLRFLESGHVVQTGSHAETVSLWCNSINCKLKSAKVTCKEIGVVHSCGRCPVSCRENKCYLRHARAHESKLISPWGGSMLVNNCGMVKKQKGGAKKENGAIFLTLSVMVFALPAEL